MDYMTVVVFILLQSRKVLSLSGHVCTRQKAEQYMTSYNKGFICPERYTTACGQLDWRRCTKYRVQTCYTPTERYATRYVTVEECCPGWQDAGAGSCTIPDCSGGCQNGGSCIGDGGVPRCLCQDGFSGDRCETERNSVDAWEVVMACALCIIIVVLIAGVVVVYRRNRPFSVSPHQQSQEESFSMSRPTDRQGVHHTGDGFGQEWISMGPVRALVSGTRGVRQPSAPVSS